MSSTNHTTNYNLPQFVGGDKPAWLGDVNPAMSAIDAQMKLNADAALAAAGAASTADGKAVSAGQAAATADGKAETAQTTANGAVARITALENKFNLTNFQSKTAPEIISVSGLTATGRLYLAEDATGSVFKFYNYIELTNATSASVQINLSAIPGSDGLYGLKVFTLSQAPEEAYTVVGAGINYFKYPPSQAATDLSAAFFVVGTDGGIYININNQATVSMPGGQTRYTSFSPCIYFNANFGDLS